MREPPTIVGQNDFRKCFVEKRRWTLRFSSRQAAEKWTSAEGSWRRAQFLHGENKLRIFSLKTVNRVWIVKAGVVLSNDWPHRGRRLNVLRGFPYMCLPMYVTHLVSQRSYKMMNEKFHTTSTQGHKTTYKRMHVTNDCTRTYTRAQ